MLTVEVRDIKNISIHNEHFKPENRAKYYDKPKDIILSQFYVSPGNDRIDRAG